MRIHKYIHENEISMNANEVFMHVIPCMKSCTAQLPMNISGARKSCQGHNSFIFIHKDIKFPCMKMKYSRIKFICMKLSCMKCFHACIFFMHETFC